MLEAGLEKRRSGDLESGGNISELELLERWNKSGAGLGVVVKELSGSAAVIDILKALSLEDLRKGWGVRAEAVPRITKLLEGISSVEVSGSRGESWGDLALARVGAGLTIRPPVMMRLEDMSIRLGLDRSDLVINDLRWPLRLVMLLMYLITGML